MPDREKVMKALTLCANGEPCWGEKYSTCPYSPIGKSEHYNCGAMMAADALALLREQEPVQFKVTQQRRSYPFWDAECDGCKYKTSTIHRNWKYCPECGRRIAWPD